MNTPEMNPQNDQAPKCPRCKAALPVGKLEGLCPACLLQQGLQADTLAPSGAFDALPVSEVAGLFPQLEILDLIGCGGMGAVYRARQRELDRVVALKILPPDIARDTAFAERFAREAKALAKLNHPNIVTIHAFGSVPEMTDGEASPEKSAGKIYYFLMEYVDGVNLRELLRNGRVAPREALAIVPPICDALQYAHDHGIVHRDIKPENILLDRQGRVKVADFGLAKLVGAVESPAQGADAPTGANVTESRQVIGTPQYMAPEQQDSPGEVDHRADIYSLGVVFYQMLTGELPTKALAPPSRKVLIDVRLDEVVLRALEKTPARRYQQVSEVRTMVETIASTPLSTERPPTPQTGAPQNNNPYAIAWPKWMRVTTIRDGRAVVRWSGVLICLTLMYAAYAVLFVAINTLLFGGYPVPNWVHLPALATATTALVRRVRRNIEDLENRRHSNSTQQAREPIEKAPDAKSRQSSESGGRNPPRNRLQFSPFTILVSLVAAGVAVAVIFGMARYSAGVTGSNAELAEAPAKLRKLSTWRLIDVAVYKPISPWAWQEIEKRPLGAAEVARIMDGLTAWMRTNYPAGCQEPLSWLRTFLDNLARRQLVNNEQAIRFIEAMQGEVRCNPLPRLRENARNLGLSAEWRNRWWPAPFGLTMINELRSLSVDGQARSPQMLVARWNSDELAGSVSLEPLAPGKHKLRIEVLSALVPSDALAGLASDAPSSEWPPARERWTRTLEAEFQIYPRDAVLVSQTRDEALDPVTVGGLKAKQVIVRAKGASLQAVLSIDPGRLTVPLAFDVSLRFGSKVIPCGTLLAWEERGSHRRSVVRGGGDLSAQLASLDPSASKVDVVCTPNPELADSFASVHQIWGREIILSDVPLDRQDLGVAQAQQAHATSASGNAVEEFAIDRATVTKGKAVIEGRATPGCRIAFFAGKQDNGWKSGFPEATPFSAILEDGFYGLRCRVVDVAGKELLNLSGARQIGTAKLDEGRIVFRSGNPEVKPDGAVIVADWVPTRGGTVPVGVALIPAAATLTEPPPPRFLDWHDPKSPIGRVFSGVLTYEVVPATERSKDTVFCPVTERTLAATDGNADSVVAFRFGSNDVVKPPLAITGHFKDLATRGFTPELKRWMHDENVDLVLYLGVKSWDVLSLEMRDGFAGQTGEWDAIAPGRALYLLEQMEKRNTEPGPCISSGRGYLDGPSSFNVFRTRGGLVGFYLLRGWRDAQGRGVNVRYKLVQGAPTLASFVPLLLSNTACLTSSTNTLSKRQR